ncbi:MAG: phosphotriesterase, partial [Candidatus Limnocylindrales bacterium]
VLIHEHVAVGSAGVLRSWPELVRGHEHMVSEALEVLGDARAAGVRSIVDATTYDLGRDMGILHEVAEQCDVHILASTGHWLMPSPTTQARSTDQLADLFIRELTEGADGTPSKAALIKVASEDEVTPFEERVLIAAALASRTTGAPILTHSAVRRRIGERQAEILEREGVDPGRVVIGHSDDSPAFDYLDGLARRGYSLGMDRLPNGRLPEYGGQGVEDRLDMIVRLVEAGHVGRLMLAHDDPIFAPLLTDEDQRRHLASNPDRISFVSRVALPGLLERGLTAADIETIMVANPRRWLSQG